jgi:hypothetical protein
MYSWFLLLYVAYMAIFVFFGSVIGLNMFRKNSYGEAGARTVWAWYACRVMLFTQRFSSQVLHGSVGALWRAAHCASPALHAPQHCRLDLRRTACRPRMRASGAQSSKPSCTSYLATT